MLLVIITYPIISRYFLGIHPGAKNPNTVDKANNTRATEASYSLVWEKSVWTGVVFVFLIFMEIRYPAEFEVIKVQFNEFPKVNTYV